MATYDDTFSARPHTLRLTVNQVSQNVGANTSTVSWSLVIIKNPSWSSYSFVDNPWSVTINGVTSSGTFTYDFRSTTSVTLGSGTRTIAHNADGTKTIAVAASASANPTYMGSASVSGNLALTTIPRASTPSFSAGTVDAGTSVTINTNRADSSFTHTVRYSIGAASGTIATGVGASTSWTPPLSLLNQIPAAVTGTMTISLDTFSGATLIGARSSTFLLRAANNIVPTIGSVTATENVALVASEVGAFVRTLSRLNVAIVGAAGAYSSTIVSNTITVDGQTINAASGVTNFLSTSGSLAVVGTVVDSRGRSASTTLNITVLPYVSPTISVPPTQVRRSDNTGVVAEQGTYLRVDIGAAVRSLVVASVEKNTLTYRISTRLRGATTWDVQTTVTPAGVTFSNFVVLSGYAITSAWEVRIEIYDKFNTSTLQSTIATATVFMHWGEGLGLGKFWESGRGSLDILGQAYQNDGLAVIDVGDVATATTAGIVELATTAEVTTGTDTQRVVTPAGLVAGLARSGGMRYVDTVYFTSSGSFTKASYPWLRGIRVIVQAGGGAGGGSAAPGSGNHNAGSGGGGGGCTEAFITNISGLASSVTVTVGAGGSGASGAAGNAGGNSSFGTVTAVGGGGGLTTAASALATSATPGEGGGGSGGDVVYSGTAGGMAGGNATLGIGGSGGSSHLGGGGRGSYTGAGSGGVAGAAGLVYGGGGSGSSTNAGGTARAGGDGAAGIVIVELYA